VPGITVPACGVQSPGDHDRVDAVKAPNVASRLDGGLQPDRCELVADHLGEPGRASTLGPVSDENLHRTPFSSTRDH
jgi:hypothetical protein